MNRFVTFFLTGIIFLHLSTNQAAERSYYPSWPSYLETPWLWPEKTLDPLPYQMHISARAGEPERSRQMEQYVESENIQGILEADLSPWTSLEGFEPLSRDACTLSITVTVRIGFDSNFVEASGTVEGIPCDDVVNAIRRLRDQLVAGIQ